MRTLARFALAAACLVAAARAEEASAPAAASSAPPPSEAPAPTAAPQPEPPAPIGVEDFARHPYGTLPALSPDGSHLAVVFRTDGARAVATRSTAADANDSPKVLGGLRYRPLWLRWTKAGRILVSIERHQPRLLLDSLEGPVESPRPIFAFNPVTRRMEIVGYDIPPQPLRKELPAGRVTYLYSFNAERGRSRHLGKKWSDPVAIQDDVLSWLPADPRRILISTDVAERFASRRTVRPSVHSMSVTTGSLRRVVPESRHVQRWFADHDGEVRLGESQANDGSAILYRREDKKLVAVPTYVKALESSVRFAAHAYDPDLIYAWAPVQGRQALVRLRLSDSSVEGVFAHREYDVAGPLVFDEARRKLVGVGFIDDAPTFHALEQTLAEERDKMERAVPGVSLEYVSESNDKQRVLVRASSDVRAPAYYLFDRSTNVMRLELLEYPRLEDEPLQPMTPVRYFARDGLEIRAYLTRPAGTPTPGAAIVLVHDGPDQRAFRRFDPLVQWLARRGFAVLEPNYRGSSGFGTELRAAGIGEWGRAMQDDLEDAAAWLVAEGVADPARIGIYGRGYGGYAALMGVARAGSPFRAAASQGGPTDLEELLEDDEKGRVETDWSRRVMGARKLRGKQLAARSPITYVASIDRPVLLLHSEHDERVRVEQAEEFAEAAEEAGKPVEFVRFESELYELSLEKNRILWFDKLTEFFERSLAPRAPRVATPTATHPEEAPHD